MKVSCILPTKNRPDFLRVALRCFRNRTYRDAELIVVDDSVDPAAVDESGDVRVIRCAGPTLLGVKMNLGIEAARGGLIQKLDDDDYYSPDFLETAAAHHRPGAIVAWDCFLVLLAGEQRFRYSGHGWKAGGTLLFERELWRRSPFREIPKSVDRWFLHDAAAPVAPVCEPEKYVLVRHGLNTWNLMQGGMTADEFLLTRGVRENGMESFVDAETAAFYRTLPAAKQSASIAMESKSAAAAASRTARSIESGPSLA